MELALAGAEITRISLGDFPLPIYDGDLRGEIRRAEACGQPEAHDGGPSWHRDRDAGVQFLGAAAGEEHDRLGDRVQDVHETRGQVFRERVFAIASASDGRLGGARALAALRLILSACRAQVIPNQLALSFADRGL